MAVTETPDAGDELADLLLTCPVKAIAWEAKVIRADGTVEDLGVIAEYHAPDAADSSLVSRFLADLHA